MVLGNAKAPSTGGGILMVEGQDDKHMVWQLCRRNSTKFSVTRNGNDLFVAVNSQTKSFGILEQGNQDRVINAIRQQVMASNPQPVGILIDIDGDLKECWNKVTKGFDRTGVNLPPFPMATGTIIPEQGFLPRIGIWLMPDNRSPGEMEDFVKGMIPHNDPVWPASESYIDSIQPSYRKFIPEKTDKAKVYAWLAARKDPGRAGAAIGANDLQVNGQLCQLFLSWLARLFG